MSFNRDTSSHRPHAVQARDRHFREDGDTVRQDNLSADGSFVVRSDWRPTRRICSKQILFAIGVITTALQGGGIIFGFSAFADQVIKLKGSPYTTTSVTSIFTIGHNITAWGCILSGVLLDKLGPRVCVVSGLIIEAVGHLLMTVIVTLPPTLAYIAYGLIGLGGCQVLLGALTFADAFRNSAVASAVLTSAFQSGGFVFMVLPFVDWVSFFEFYAIFCCAAAVLTVAVYPDAPLPSYVATRENSDLAEMSGAFANRRTLKSTLLRPGTVWFMLTFMVAGSALTYGIGEFVAAVKVKDNCDWDDGKADFVNCENQSLQGVFNNVLMPLVGNFILPVSLVLGRIIDKCGFALPAFINIFFVQAFVLALWLLPLQAQFATLFIYNVANTAVFTVQNAYICSVGHEHIGALFSISNFAIGAGNLLSDWLTMNPFGSGKTAISESLVISSIVWLVICTPLYLWVFVEHSRQRRRRAGLESFKEGFGAGDDARAGTSIERTRSFPLLGHPTFEVDQATNSISAVVNTLGRIGGSFSQDSTAPIITFNPVLTVNPREWHRKLDAVLEGGRDNVFCVFDFDRTVTKCFLEDGTRSLDCHDILASISKITQECRQGMEDMMEYYYPIEIHPTMTREQKVPYMVEWYSKVNMLLASQNLTRDDVAWAVAQCKNFRIRSGVEEAFRISQEKKIPIIIVSAGLGNIIEEVVQQRIVHNSEKRDAWTTIRVLSNTLVWDEDGQHVGFSEPLLHMYNKSLQDAPQELRDVIKGRHVGILCGDGTGDLTMTHGHECSEVLKFGFLNERVEERMPKYIGADGYDKIVLNDGSFEAVLEVLRRL